MGKKYFITGGGTGGHIYPAVAVADALLKLEDTDKIYYVGNPNNLEASIVKDKDFEFLPVNSSGMPRKIGFALFKWGFKMLFASIKCCFYILKYRPDKIFGTGGYVSAPVLFAGVVMKVPYVMHDCDAQPGLVTRAFKRFAQSVSVAFDSSKSILEAGKSNDKFIVNGNPIREEFKILTKEQARLNLNLENRMTLCIMGGSQGAKTINSAAVEVLKSLSQELNLQVIFQTGKKNYEQVVSKLEEVYPEYKSDKNLIVQPYFDNMTEVLKATDIAVSRAGSLSISELCACSIATIFVPYPYAAANHQEKNAQCLVDMRAGLLLKDSETNPKTMYTCIKELVTNEKLLVAIRNSAGNLAKFDGCENIVKQILA